MEHKRTMATPPKPFHCELEEGGEVTYTWPIVVGLTVVQIGWMGYPILATTYGPVEIDGVRIEQDERVKRYTTIGMG